MLPSTASHGGNHRHVRSLSPTQDQPDIPTFDVASLEDTPWTADLAEVPDDASAPRWFSPPHPDAVGSFGQEIEDWVHEEQGVTFRWWQRLTTRRQFEHDQDGNLLWATIVESCSRRVGKSTRLRGIATWRMAHAEQFGEEQLVIHTGSDLAICREVQQRCWRWAEARAWNVTRGNGKESLETPDGHRWLVRAQSAVYGWDTTMGLVDEGWDVPPEVVDEGLEPSLMERQQPQLVLTSTAHRRSTPLMRRRIQAALAGLNEDWSTMLALWGVGPTDDITDPAVWKQASAYWTPARARMIADKYERAQRGEADPEADDPDPVAGWACQYLNRWPAPAQVLAKGEPVVTTDEWADLSGFQHGKEHPQVVAIESWFSEGAAVAACWRLAEGSVGVEVHSFPDVPSAAAWAALTGAPLLLVGKSIASQIIGSEPIGSTTRQAVQDLRRMLDDQHLRHDGSEVLAEQVLALRTTPTPDGIRVVSKGRADALKAVTWAANAALAQVEVPMIF